MPGSVKGNPFRQYVIRVQVIGMIEIESNNVLLKRPTTLRARLILPRLM